LWSLWRVSASGGEPEPLEVGERAGYLTLSRQGGRLVYATYDRDWDIWRVGGPSARDEDKSPSRLIASSEMESYPHYSPDGRKISFTSTRSGNREIWICDSDGSNARQLTFLEDVTVDGNWSPDGKQIAFRSSKEGSHDIYVMNETGGFPRRLTTEASDEYAPRWSRDGRWIYFSSNRTGRLELYKVPSQGGKAIQLTRNYGTIGYESFDGQYLYFAKYGLGRGTFGIWRIPRDGGEEIQVYGRVHWRLWQVLEKGIYFINRDSAPSTVEFLDFATGETRQVAVLEGVPFGYGFSVSPDERWFLYQIHENEQDIMVVENFR
jgi:Tol biopolymer transport system component